MRLWPIVLSPVDAGELPAHCAVHNQPYRQGAGQVIEAFDAPHCSWDGSLHPDVFMELIENGAQLGPTDKNYKVYVEMGGVDDGRADDEVIVGSTNASMCSYPDWVPVTRKIRRKFKERNISDSTTFVHIRKRGDHRHDKFYFEHLSVEQRQRFFELLTDGKLNIGMPGHFYVLPYFLTRRGKV